MYNKYNIRNTQGTPLIVANIIIILGILGWFVPDILEIDGMDGGFAIKVLSAFLLILPGTISLFIYRKRYRVLAALLNGEGLLAAWQIDLPVWNQFAELNYKEDKEGSFFLFKLVAVISIVVGIIMAIALEDVFALIICLGIIFIVAIPAILAPRIRKKRLEKNERWVLIGEKAVYLNSLFYNWGIAGSRYKGAELISDQGLDTLLISYDFITRAGKQTDTVRVPVPGGKVEEAKGIIRLLKSRN